MYKGPEEPMAMKNIEKPLQAIKELGHILMSEDKELPMSYED